MVQGFELRLVTCSAKMPYPSYPFWNLNSYQHTTISSKEPGLVPAGRGRCSPPELPVSWSLDFKKGPNALLKMCLSGVSATDFYVVLTF